MQNDNDRRIDFAPIEARLLFLLRGGDGYSRQRLEDLLPVMDRHMKTPAIRIKFLLFVASGISACRTGRVSIDRLKELFGDEINGGLTATPEGRMVDRHRLLLLTMVRRGCELRGEIPTVNRKETSNANA